MQICKKSKRIPFQASGRIPTPRFTKKELQDLGVTKIPSSEKIQKRIENLESEQAATVREKQKLQKKQKTLDIIQQNFSVLLDAPEINSDLLPAKREPVSVTRDK